MAIESAKSFVEKFYGNDEFMKQLYRMGAFIGGKAHNKEDEEAQARKLTEVAQGLGYDFTVEEYNIASDEYIKNLGGWKGLKMIFHMMKVVKSAEREMKKNK